MKLGLDFMRVIFLAVLTVFLNACASIGCDDSDGGHQVFADYVDRYIGRSFNDPIFRQTFGPPFKAERFDNTYGRYFFKSPPGYTNQCVWSVVANRDSKEISRWRFEENQEQCKMLCGMSRWAPEPNPALQQGEEKN